MRHGGANGPAYTFADIMALVCLTSSAASAPSTTNAEADMGDISQTSRLSDFVAHMSVYGGVPDKAAPRSADFVTRSRHREHSLSLA